MANSSVLMPVTVQGGGLIRVQATNLDPEQDISLSLPDFKQVTDSIRAIAAAVGDVLEEISPTKASVEFGVEVGVDAGSLVALLVKGTGKSTFKIVLEWEK
jgi:hypothetical protein